jgi:CBS domain-containing protein
MANLVKDLLRIKGGRVWSVTPKTTLLEALKLMAEKNIGALIVLEGEKVAGIISERDMARKLAMNEMGCKPTMPVEEFMTEEVYVVKPDDSINECMQLMTMKHFRHLPVMEGGKLEGLISIGDVVKQVIDDQQSTIISMENYILGRGYGM